MRFDDIIREVTLANYEEEGHELRFANTDAGQKIAAAVLDAEPAFDVTGVLKRNMSPSGTKIQLGAGRGEQVTLGLQDSQGHKITIVGPKSMGGAFNHAGNNATADVMSWEKKALADVNSQLQQMKGDNAEIPIIIGDREVMVAAFEDTPGTPKSDFHALDANGNEVAWISHKKGKVANDFGQWGGCSEKELAVVYKRYPELQGEIMSFVDAVKQEVGGDVFEGGRGSTYGRKIQNGELKGIAVYGRDFVPHKQGGADRGRQNVDLVLQGNPYFEGNRLLADGNVHVNGERVEGSFEPILIVRKSSDRSNFGLDKSRFSFYPEGGRKIGKWI